MLPTVLSISIAKTFSPYLRQHLLEDLTSHEFIFINSCLIAFFSFMYAYIHRQEDISNLFKLSYTQYISAFVISIVTILSSVALIRLEEDGILTTTFIMRAVSSILLVMVGIFYFEEQLTTHQLVGIFLGMIGALLIMK